MALLAAVTILLAHASQGNGAFTSDSGENRSIRAPSRRRAQTSEGMTDEFDDPATLGTDWTDEFPQYVSTATITNGALVISPDDTQNFGWYAASTGIFFSKSVAAGDDFVAEIRLDVSAPGGGGPPTGSWHSAGLLLRAAADDNYVHINLGRQGAANGMPVTVGTQHMSTVNGASGFSYRVSAGDVTSGRLRICRVGDQVGLLRNLDSDGGWTYETTAGGGAGGPFPRPELDDDASIGIMSSRWSGAGTFTAEVEWFRYAVPESVADCLVDDISSIGGGTTTAEPTTAPTTAPTQQPTESPTELPTAAPVDATETPTVTPTAQPTDQPTEQPTALPVDATESPTFAPTVQPTDQPTAEPIDPAAAPLSDLSDDFFLPSTLSDWTDEYGSERHDSVEIFDGILILTPVDVPANVWYNSMYGSFLHKRVESGNDFVVETLVNVRVGESGLPEGAWHSGGLMIRSVASPGNWVVNNVGNQGAFDQANLPYLDQTYGMEGKTTVDNVSVFNYVADPTLGMTARIRLCRVGSAVTLMHMFVPSQTEWSVQSPVPGQPPAPIDRPDLVGAVDVGIMANRFGAAANTFTARFDYVRFSSVSTQEDCFGPV